VTSKENLQDWLATDLFICGHFIRLLRNANKRTKMLGADFFSEKPGFSDSRIPGA
jgi:hypothetical protein